MLFNFATVLHMLAAVIWVGGMFFAHMILRPAAMDLDPPQRLTLWLKVFRRFFIWVWIAVVVLLLTGLWLMSLRGWFAGSGIYIHVMFSIGLVMSIIFAAIYFGPYQRLRQHLALAEWPAAGEAQGRIRTLVTLNLVLGLITVIVATGFKAW